MPVFASPPHSGFDIGEGDAHAIPDSRLRDLAAYWFGRRENGLTPLRQAIDPLEFPALLPNVILLDRVSSPTGDRFRFRLVGTQVVEIAGRELTGRFLDEALPPAYAEFVARLNHLAIARQRPVYASSLYHDEGNFVNGLTYRLVMPLRHTGHEPDMLFVCQFWQRRADGGYWTGDWRSVRPEITVITTLRD